MIPSVTAIDCRSIGRSVKTILLCFGAAICWSAVMRADAVAADPSPAAQRVVSPDEVLSGDLPPFVQLEPDKDPVVWDPQEIDEFQLLDQNGNRVTRESLLGKPWLANFIFTRCVTACPMTCRRIMELSESLRDVDVRFVTITVDPEHDGVEQMAQFAEIWQADPDRWLFCTGDKEQVYRLIRHGFKISAWENFGTARQPGYEFAHDNHLIHIDAAGRVLGRYNGVVPSELAELSKVLRGEMETPRNRRPVILAESATPAAAVRRDPLTDLPAWAKRLPKTNAMLNALATLLLLVGLGAIKAKRVALHKQMMLSAFGVSILFLVCYLSYHVALHQYTGSHGKEFTGSGTLRVVYFSVLISHVILAAAVPVLALVTLVKGLRQKWESHRRWAKVTFPIWLYVSVTGVIIYLMLYGTG